MDLNVCRVPWFSIGLHVDHRHKNIVVYLPFVIVAVGWMAQSRSGWSLR